MKKKIVFYVLQSIIWGIVLIISLNFQDPWDVPSKYKNMKNPYKGEKDIDRIGFSLYRTHCKSCHGKTGLGDGTKATELETVMRELTSNEVRSQTDGELYYKSIIGRDEMANFEKKIPDEEDRWLLINYVRNLQE
ncbi:MAG: cytochrome c [Bacteroidales bacterium]|nr:MAG: cytochrome c [Bacteroidales bacterium]